MPCDKPFTMAWSRWFDGEEPMTVDAGGPGDAATIDLALEPPFALGHVTVTPAALAVEARAWSRRLEPRVMQVLVVLAHAAPAVVGRAELNARVWAGRVVGDDAINRAVQALRRVAAEAPPPAPFSIQTVPRVGYRLAAGDADDAGEHGQQIIAARGVRALPSPAITRPRQRRRAFGSLAIAGALGLLVFASWRYVGGGSGRAWAVAGFVTFQNVPAGASDVTLSADGRHLAYRQRDAAGRDRIYARGASEDAIAVAVSPADIDAHGPAWSPNGADLAFVGFDPSRPCRLYVKRGHGAARPAGACETARDPRVAWSADGGSLLFGDAPGENAVQRITAVTLADGARSVLSSPPGESLGDAMPLAQGSQIIFRRLFGWADEGWIARQIATGDERPVWRRRGVAGTAAALLPDGTLAVAWTRAGQSGLDFVGSDGRTRSEPVALGPITAIGLVDGNLLVATDQPESSLARAGEGPLAGSPLLTTRGLIVSPVALAGKGLRFVVVEAGIARIWQRYAASAAQPWGSFSAARIAGLAPSPDGRLTAALVTGDAGREIVVLDRAGVPVFRWNPRARSLNAAAWSVDGRGLTVPVLDGAGWRLFAIDPFRHAPPRDMAMPGFAVLVRRGPALYAVRAGETTGIRELWRLDGRARRLPIDLTLSDIVNWVPAARGVWLPDRIERKRPYLVLHAEDDGRVLRRLAAPELAGPGAGLTADATGPVYVRAPDVAPEYATLLLSHVRDAADARASAR